MYAKQSEIEIEYIVTVLMRCTFYDDRQFWVVTVVDWQFITSMQSEFELCKHQCSSSINCFKEAFQVIKDETEIEPFIVYSNSCLYYFIL